jgi:hypothetical protein
MDPEQSLNNLLLRLGFANTTAGMKEKVEFISACIILLSAAQDHSTERMLSPHRMREVDHDQPF